MAIFWKVCGPDDASVKFSFSGFLAQREAENVNNDSWFGR